MITDAQLMFSDSQALAVAAGTTLSTNAIDLGVARQLERSGRNLRFVSEVTVAGAGGTSIQVQLIQSAAANLGAPDVLYSGPVVALAALVAGAKLADTNMPATDPVAAKRYLGAQYVTLGTFTALSVWTGLVMNDEGGELRLGQVGF